MLVDALLQVSSGQSLAGAAATTASTNTIDLNGTSGAQNRDVGAGNDLYLNCLVTEAFAGGTTVRIDIIVSANANLSSPQIIASTRAIPTANLPIGRAIDIPVPPLEKSAEARYLGAQYTTVGTYTTGKLTAGFGLDKQSIPGKSSYRSGYTVQK